MPVFYYAMRQKKINKVDSQSPRTCMICHENGKQVSQEAMLGKQFKSFESDDLFRKSDGRKPGLTG